MKKYEFYVNINILTVWCVYLVGYLVLMILNLIVKLSSVVEEGVAHNCSHLVSCFLLTGQALKEDVQVMLKFWSLIWRDKNYIRNCGNLAG